MAKAYEQIYSEMLANVPPDIDKRDGSAVQIPISAATFQFYDTHIKLDNMYSEAFLPTASGEYLDILARDFGYSREMAVPATVKAELVGNTIPVGTRFLSSGTEAIMYKVTVPLTDNLYLMEAAEVNPLANYYTGELIMVDYINNLKSAKITEIVIPQKETETDEEFRTRIQGNLIAEAADGNTAQFYKWISEIDGVGKARVNPLAYGENTVGVAVLNELNTPASAELIKKVQDELDPNSEGKGNGKATIGQKVTVTTPTEFLIDIAVTVVYRQGKTSSPTLKSELESFFGEIALERSAVSYLQIGSVITNNADIDYVTSLTLNGASADLPIPENKVAVLGELNVTA